MPSRKRSTNSAGTHTLIRVFKFAVLLYTHACTYYVATFVYTHSCTKVVYTRSCRNIGYILIRVFKFAIVKLLLLAQILKKLIGAVDDDPQNVTLLDWTPWKMGVAFSHRGRTLLVIKEEDNMAPEADDGVEWLPSKKRIEIHVYAQDWFEVQNELFANGRPAPLLQNAFSLPGIATQLLMKISQHILSLAKVFRSLLETKSIYIPCWKCYGNMEPSADVGESAAKNNHFFPVVRSGRNIPVYAFHHEKCIILAAQGHDLQCPNHGPIKVVHTAPDLVGCYVRAAVLYIVHTWLMCRVSIRIYILVGHF